MIVGASKLGMYKKGIQWCTTVAVNVSVSMTSDVMKTRTMATERIVLQLADGPIDERKRVNAGTEIGEWQQIHEMAG